MAARVTPNNLIADARMTESVFPDDWRAIAGRLAETLAALPAGPARG